MAEKKSVVLTGNDLTVEQIIAVGVGDLKVELDEQALQRCRDSRTFLEEAVNARHIIYGVNTSFGPMCNKIIDDNEIEALQVNLIRSHAAGLGDPLKPYIGLAVMLVRLNTLVKGYSGVRIELLEFMQWMINEGVAPYIPECGSVGASGDLIHLAHLALGIIGEGNVYYRDELRPAADVFAELGREPMRLSYKEGIALMNGTSAMTALAAFAIFGAKKLLRVSCVTGAFGIELFGGIDDAFDEDLHKIKPHPGQVEIAEIIRNLYRGSGNITLRENMHDQIRGQHQEGLVFETTINVQDVYSIRCTPQVLAPAAEMIESATRTVEVEANSSNDNPIIVPDKKKIIHGGNFHGQSIGFAMDALCISLSTLCNLSERRLNKLLDKNLNEGLPEHLIPGTLGLTMGFMGSQYLATSTTAENRQLANPVSTNSISCNASNQDVVSMGTVAARKAFKQVSNAKHILTMEVLADMQALSFRNADRLGLGTSRIYAALNDEFQIYDNSRVFHDDLVAMRKKLFSSQMFDDLSGYWS
ncbi:aromatic amino acid ammonia-lyase [uncultured Desulfuromonas sp.]|uniref:HAL/PAL/TAL family ammonia-lyase n=1 Tax=uncultured Desulfuromonas sp. TaxID=181013 RepID=UPI002AAC2F6F|nr:aromatic amino acid ammonia-lyase [uncultured Desulfuromonas sp.]